MNRILILVLIFISTISYSQENALPEYKNELKINAAYLLAGLPEITYERILSDDSAVGISVAFPLDEDINLNFLAIPYYMLYFGKKRAAGFFMEANAAIFSEEPTYYDYTDFNGSFVNRTEDSELGLGLGLGIGVKLMAKEKWIGEILGGLGRNFINEDEITEFYPRLGITIGRRF